MVLRVILQIVPHGDEDAVREIGRLDIYNKGPRYGVHEYGVINLTPKQEGLYSDTVLHSRNNGPWELLREAIDMLQIQ